MAFAASNGPAVLMASELMSRGRKSAVALEALLQAASTTMTSNAARHDDIRELAEQILCCLDRALAALHIEGVDDDDTGGCPSKKRTSPPGAAAQARHKRRAGACNRAEVPTRVEKRSTPVDGFLWRKYGQKEILHSKYPRTYFRCTYKNDNGCKATRQVQQSEDDPSVYVVTYFGEHTCGMHSAATAAGGQDEKSPQSVISFRAGSTTSGSPWFSSDDDVRSNSSQFTQAVCLPGEDGGEQKANVCNVESSVLAPPAERSSPADVSCASPDLDSLPRYFDWDHFFGDILLDMEFINVDEAVLLP